VKGKERRAVAPDWRAIYQAATAEGAEQEREILVARWDAKYPTLSALWRRHWEQITPWFAFPPEIRSIIYATNAVESWPMTLRKVIKTRASFPNQEAALKLLCLALRNVSKQWGLLPNGQEALNRFALLWEARFPQQAP
jgi:putative transposase